MVSAATVVRHSPTHLGVDTGYAIHTTRPSARRWAPMILAGVEKSSTHSAIEDVRDSIRELRYYREHFLVAGGGTTA